MALHKGTNAYATVMEAEAYFKDRLDAGWASAETEKKAQALVTATSILDDRDWPGIAVSESQSLAFPRSGTYFDPKKGYEVSMDPVPARIITATCELANHLLTNENLQDEGVGLESLDVGPIRMKFTGSSENRALLPEVVLRLIKPLTTNKGANTWWRAN